MCRVARTFSARRVSSLAAAAVLSMTPGFTGAQCFIRLDQLSQWDIFCAVSMPAVGRGPDLQDGVVRVPIIVKTTVCSSKRVSRKRSAPCSARHVSGQQVSLPQAAHEADEKRQLATN